MSLQIPKESSVLVNVKRGAKIRDAAFPYPQVSTLLSFLSQAMTPIHGCGSIALFKVCSHYASPLAVQHHAPQHAVDCWFASLTYSQQMDCWFASMTYSHQMNFSVPAWLVYSILCVHQSDGIEHTTIHLTHQFAQTFCLVCVSRMESPR